MSTTDAWAIYQTRLEIQRFELALFHHMSGSDPDQANLGLRFDLLFSRLEAMKTSEDRDRYLSALHVQPGDPNASSATTQVDALLAAMEHAPLETDAIPRAHPDLPSAPDAACRILALLDPQSKLLSDLAAPGGEKIQQCLDDADRRGDRAGRHRMAGAGGTRGRLRAGHGEPRRVVGRAGSPRRLRTLPRFR